MTFKRILRHFLFWLIYYTWRSYVMASYDFKYERAFISTAITLPVQILVTYTILYYLFPKFFLTKKYLHLSIYFIFLILMSGIFYRIIYGNIVLPYYYPEMPFTPWDGGRYVWALFEVISVASIALCIKLFLMRFDDLKREKELEKEKMQSELSFLKAQINPHFLFNTLNNIYGLSLKGSEKASDSILKLSELLRFILHDGSMQEIKISDEIRIICDYIELEKLRYGDRLKIIFEKEMDDDSQKISPMILLSFVENSFKHGASESRFHSNIRIFLKLKNGYLAFSVHNTKEGGEYNDNGIGLKNIRRQLQLIYGDNHHIDFKNSSDLFEAYLWINLREHENAELSNS